MSPELGEPVPRCSQALCGRWEGVVEERGGGEAQALILRVPTNLRDKSLFITSGQFYCFFTGKPVRNNSSVDKFEHITRLIMSLILFGSISSMEFRY